MKVFKVLLFIFVFFLLLGGTWFYLEHSLPSDETIKQEFLKQNPDLKNVEIENVELIFEYPEKEVLMYLIKFRKSENGEILTEGFSVKQNWNFQWQWCDNRAERKCD